MRYNMKQIKRCLICCTCMLCMFCLAGCEEKESTVASDKGVISSRDVLETLGEQLIESKLFEAEMAEVNKKMVAEAYKLENETIIQSYMSAASKADEITIIQTSNLEQTKQLVETYLKDREGVFESYAPEEAKKLQQALVMTYEKSGKGVDGTKESICIICVAGEVEEAKKLIRNHVE